MSLSTAYAPDDLLTLPDGERCELVDGELREKEMGAESDWIAFELGGLLRPVVVSLNRGWLFGAQTGYRCFPDDPGKVRKPDVSLILTGRLPGERIPKGHIDIPPDLAVEVVSPNDRYADVQDKVAEYLAAGVRLVWVVNPDLRNVHVYRADGSVAVLTAEQELDGADLLPEFRVRVADIFPNRQDG